MNVIGQLLKKLRKGKNVNFKLWSYIALGVGIFFLLGAFLGVDESTKDTLPVILSIAIIGGISFVAFKLFDKLQKEQLVEEEKERLAKEEKERLAKEEQVKKEQEKAPQELITDYKKALDAASSYIDVNVTSLEKKYENLIGTVHFRKLIYDVIKERYFEGDKKACKYLVQILDYCLHENVVKNLNFRYSYREDPAECYRIAEDQAVAIAIRALHFEKYGYNKNNYPNITKDICREFLLSINYFEGSYSNERSVSITHVLDELTVRIKYGPYLPSSKTDRYYLDSLCNSYWKARFKNGPQESLSDPNYIFNGLYNSFKPNEQDLKRIEKQKMDRQQCHACAFYDRCQLPYENRTLNCSGFIPK